MTVVDGSMCRARSNAAHQPHRAPTRKHDASDRLVLIIDSPLSLVSRLEQRIVRQRPHAAVWPTIRVINKATNAGETVMHPFAGNRNICAQSISPNVDRWSIYVSIPPTKLVTRVGATYRTMLSMHSNLCFSSAPRGPPAKNESVVFVNGLQREWGPNGRRCPHSITS